MDQQQQNQKSKRKINKGFVVLIVLTFVIIFGWAGLTKAGFIPNYFAIEFLCSEQYKPNIPYSPVGESNPDPSCVKECMERDDTISEGTCKLLCVPALKPVIYLYPLQEQEVDVKLTYSGQLTVSYPEYNNGWQVTAYPDGKIINTEDGREYSYLFWEGVDQNVEYDFSSGFIVSGLETVEFLQEKLSKLGLTPKEYNEFIVYWLPQMQNNNFNLVHFATKEEYDDRAVLDIAPKPDSVLRVFMVFKGLNNKMKIEPQELNSFERNGFVVVEWGGTEIK